MLHPSAENDAAAAESRDGAIDTAVLEHNLAPIRPLLDVEGVTELVINEVGVVGVENATGWQWHDVPQLDMLALKAIAQSAAAYTKQDIDAENPVCSTVLPTGERVQLVVPPALEPGRISITIRKPSTVNLSIEDFHVGGLFEHTVVAEDRVSETDAAMKNALAERDYIEFFKLAVRTRKNILISGATGSGKTTFSKGLIQLIPDHERLLTIEDTRELTLPHRNVVNMLYAKDGQGLAKITAKELLESALRMRPDRILLQELRDGTAFFYLRNVNSGHPGSITTIHADSAKLALEQLGLLVKESEAGSDLSRADIQSLLNMLVDVIVQVKKIDGKFRATEIYFEPRGER